MAANAARPELSATTLSAQFWCGSGSSRLPNETQLAIYPGKHDLLSDYLRQQLKSPTIHTMLA